MALFALVAGALTSFVLGGFAPLDRGGEQTQATYLAQEALEAIKSVRDNTFNEIIYAQSAATSTTGEWTLMGEGTDEVIGKYTRTITYSNVCRDINDDITVCPGYYTDLHTLLVKVTVSWTTENNVSTSVEQSTYITNWDSYDWTQTDWSGGSGQNIWSVINEYDSDNGEVEVGTAGEVSLPSGSVADGSFDLAADSSYSWPFTASGNYIYDNAKIEITGGLAQLIATGGVSGSGETINEEFATSTAGWTFATWDAGGGEITPTGIWQNSGGDPSGYININLPSNAKNDEVGGYWEQEVTVGEDGSTVTCYFDWRIPSWTAGNGVDDLQLYVFLDSASGAPAIGTEIWSSGTQSGITSWSTQQSVDCSSVATTAGTYYYKIAVWLDAKNKSTGPITIGYDNAKVSWTKSGGSSYPTDLPDIYPTSSFSISGLDSWSGFTETATKNGGEIYYQLSNDDGSTWQYWNGSSWATAGASNYNTASVINTNIGSFSTLNEQIKFKAYLESNGSQLVQLDNVNIAYSMPASVWSYVTWGIGPGEATPSGNYNTTNGNPDGYVDVTIPVANNDTIGGYWEQPFTTYTDNPADLAIDFDYKVIDYNSTPDVLEIRVYVDTATGDPVTQVGSSIPITAEGAWTSATTIDPSVAITTAGTYYLKVALWAETPGGNPGPYTVGFDNVSLELGDSEYPALGTLVSSAYDMSTTSAVQIISWTEDKPAGTDIQFQLRSAPDSAGSPGTWTTWYGDGGAGTYFTHATGTLVSTDLNDNNWVQYRVELSGDGSETPTLSEVKINYK